MVSVRNIAFAATTVLCAASGAQAAQLDFTTVGLGNQGAQIVLPEATVDLLAGDYLIVGDFVDNAVCAIDSGCNGSFRITFNFDVQNVNFEYGFGNTGDSAVVTALDAADAVLGTRNLNLTSGTAFEDIAALGVLRSLIFDATASTGAGYAFGNINFERAPAAIPVPAALPLLASALAGFALLRRRHKAA